MTLAYKTGQITLTNGSASVVGVGTAWETSLIAGGVIYPQADGNPLPIDSVDGDLGITSATKWMGASGTYDYALVRDTAYLQQVSANSAKLAQLVAELAAGTVFKYDASGDLAGRATYDERPKDFAYLVSIDVEQPQLYVKASAASGDWSGPFNYGTGPMGPATTLNFGATVTVSPSTPASATVTGDGPYNIVFHIPRGADGDMEPVGPWTAGSNYSAKQVATDNGSAYVCKADHVAAAANEPGIGATWATYWYLLVAKGNQGNQGPAGAMDPSVYDPQAVAGDAFSLAKMHGAMAIDLDLGSHKLIDGLIDGAVAFADPAAPTKRAHFSLAGITAGQNRTIILPDRDVVVNPAWEMVVDLTIPQASAISSFDQTGLAAYKRLKITGWLRPATLSSKVYLRVGTGTPLTSASYYQAGVYGASGGGSGAMAVISGGTYWEPSAGAALNANSNGGKFSFEIDGFNDAASVKAGLMGGGVTNSSGFSSYFAHVLLASAPALSSVHFLFDNPVFGKIMIEGQR